MQPRISIITLGVSDLQRSITFYKDGLGLPLKEGEGEGIAFFLTKGTWLALFPKEELAQDARVDASGNGFTGFTLAHNVESKQEVDRILKHAQSIGGTITKSAEDVSWGGYSGYFKDPDGYLWEIAWNPYFAIE